MASHRIGNAIPVVSVLEFEMHWLDLIVSEKTSPHVNIIRIQTDKLTAKSIFLMISVESSSSAANVDHWFIALIWIIAKVKFQ